MPMALCPVACISSPWSFLSSRLTKLTRLTGISYPMCSLIMALSKRHSSFVFLWSYSTFCLSVQKSGCHLNSSSLSSSISNTKPSRKFSCSVPCGVWAELWAAWKPRAEPHTQMESRSGKQACKRPGARMRPFGISQDPVPLALTQNRLQKF